MNFKTAINKAYQGGVNIWSFGLGSVKGELGRIMNDETAAMEDKVISLTIILVIIAVVLIPVGYTTMKSTNLSEGGVTPSATETTIFNVIPLLVLVAVILGIISLMKTRGD